MRVRETITVTLSVLLGGALGWLLAPDTLSVWVSVALLLLVGGILAVGMWHITRSHTVSEEEVREAAETQRRFVANASHELRTPLTVMRTEIDVTLSDPDASVQDLRRMGSVVRDASRRANDLIDALLLLARSEAVTGRRLNREVPVDLSVGIPRTLRTAEKGIRDRHLSVETYLEPARVQGDPNLLERLAGNLIENAVRHNSAHGVLAVRCGVQGKWAYLIVENTGAEVSPHAVPELFEAFRRGGTERTGTRGAGLGLSIVRAVVEAHAGHVSAKPRVGGGLIVTVWLPAD